MKFEERFSKIEYSALNSKQKENYNFHKIASALANYGFNSMRLNDDWQGADFISIYSLNGEIIKVQLKGRFTLDKKYIGKDLYVAFVEGNKSKIYFHDDALNLILNKIENSASWKEKGLYSWGTTPEIYSSIITVLEH